MKHENVVKAAEIITRSEALHAWLKESWYATDNKCQLVYATEANRHNMVELTMTPVRVAVCEEIRQLQHQLADLGVE